MNREQYLASHDVQQFIEWMRPRLCTEGGFRHRYTDQRGEWSCTSVFEAYQKYYWHGDLPETQRTLARLSTAMRDALYEEDADSFTEAGIAVLRWGGVLPHNRGTLEALGQGAPTVFPLYSSSILRQQISDKSIMSAS